MHDEVATIEMKLECTMQCLKISREEAHEWRMKHDPEYAEQIRERNDRYNEKANR